MDKIDEFATSEMSTNNLNPKWVYDIYINSKLELSSKLNIWETIIYKLDMLWTKIIISVRNIK